MLVQHIFQQEFHHIYNDKGRCISIDSLLQGEHGQTRSTPALSNEWGHLAQGNSAGVESTDTVNFIPYSEVPQDKKVTNDSFVRDHGPLTDEI